MDELKPVDIRLWQYVQKDLQATLDELRGLVIIMHNSVSFSDIISFLNDVRPQERSNVLFISLNHSTEHIRQTLHNHPLTNKTLFIMDCVSHYISENLQNDPYCMYQKTPRTFEDIHSLMLQAVNWSHPNMIVVDSLPNYIDLHAADDDLTAINQFLRFVKTEILNLVLDTTIVFYQDKTGELKKIPRMYPDHILRYEVIKDKPAWYD